MQACVSQKTRKLYGPEKPFVRLRPSYSGKLVFSYVEKGIKMKITAKFRDTEQLSFWKMRIMSPEKFRDFRETGPRCGAKFATWWWNCATPRPWRYQRIRLILRWVFRIREGWKNNRIWKEVHNCEMIYDIYCRTCLVFQQTRSIV